MVSLLGVLPSGTRTTRAVDESVILFYHYALKMVTIEEAMLDSNQIGPVQLLYTLGATMTTCGVVHRTASGSTGGCTCPNFAE